MVVICAPSRPSIGVWQDRVAWPLMCTVQAPHWAMPQPYFVPVSPSSSRSTHSRGVSGADCTVTALPLILSVLAMGRSPRYGSLNDVNLVPAEGKAGRRLDCAGALG